MFQLEIYLDLIFLKANLNNFIHPKTNFVLREKKNKIRLYSFQHGGLANELKKSIIYTAVVIILC